MAKIWTGESRYGRLLLFVPLFLLSKIYGLILSARETLYKKGVLKVDEVFIPVISVGNISLGGSGKTPVVERLALLLKDNGLNPAIVTRGYKRSRKGIFTVDRIHDTAREVGDEALMLARRTTVPVVVGTRRGMAIVEAMRKYGADVAILDDGFQVRNLRKNVEIVVIKGNGGKRLFNLFPLGPCREPLERLREADAVLMNGKPMATDVENMIRHVPTFRMTYRPLHLYNMKYNRIAHYNVVRGRKVLAFSGLGDNRSFFRLLRELEAEVVKEYSFRDHHAYSEEDIKKIASFKGASLIITTEKDAVKILGMPMPDNLFYLSVEAEIEREQEFLDVVMKRIQEADGLVLPAHRGNRDRKYWVH